MNGSVHARQSPNGVSIRRNPEVDHNYNEDLGSDNSGESYDADESLLPGRNHDHNHTPHRNDGLFPSRVWMAVEVRAVERLREELLTGGNANEMGEVNLADLLLSDQRPMCTPLELCIQMAHEDHQGYSNMGTYPTLEILTLLLEHGADTARPDATGRNALGQLTYNATADDMPYKHAMVQILLEHGADPTCCGVGVHASSSLQNAAYVGWMGVIPLLLSYGADVNKTYSDPHWTPLHIAAGVW